MELGIIGLPQSGKTTLFNALTRGDVPTGISGGKVEVHTAVIDVPDERVDRLTELFKSKKIVYAKVTYADVAGLEGKAAEGGIPVRCSTPWAKWMASSMSCASSTAPWSRTGMAALIPSVTWRIWKPN